MYLNKLTTKYIDAMTLLTMKDIRTNISKEKKVYCSVLKNYFKFLSNLTEDSDDFKYTKCVLFTELREPLIYNDIPCQEIFDNAINYFSDAYSCDYDDMPLIIRECLYWLDSDFMAEEICESYMEILDNQLNLGDFEQSEEFQNSIYLFTNKYTIETNKN